ncbi:hypothetical protein Hamer_G015393 [Homarus americanus]|uniref:Uncharacterized protein n=2 Tax=Homarus americanus TaxID=6706 RepID=A0A8J5NAR0_HOMAM|nr:hypothetical protein Hamer_G015393 [Homarus americanus]
MRRSDGTCVVSVTVAPPTMPTHQGSGRIGHAPTSRRKPKTAQGMDGGMSGSVIFPVIICIIIFLTFCVLMLIIAYSFRVHNRRLAARRSYHVVASTPRRSPVCGRRDVPPYYTSLPPPSYDQATLNASGPLHISSRYSSCTASIETTPYTLSSPDMSSSISYGSLLTRSFLLTPSDHAPSLTDLTTGDARRDRGDTTPSPPHRY